MTVETTALARRSERCPDLDEDAIGQTVFTIIKEWFMDATSATAYAVSPLWVKSRSLMVLESYEVSPHVKILIQEWIRYCANQTGLDQSLTEAAVEAVPADRDEAKAFDAR
jgi:hypothetical protein